MKGRILIIDDDDAILQSCRTILEDAGCDVETACGGDAGLALLRQRSFDVALIDLKMPKKDGLEVLAEATAVDSDLVALIFTAYGSIESAVDAVKKGAFNYLTKPFTSGQLAAAVGKALEHRRLLRENVHLRHELKQCCPAHQIIGSSSSLQMVLATLAKVAPSEANVLITGESGTGKELVARAIHPNSTRADGPFIAVDCAALPSTLLESELFGYEKGAFTGAHQSKRGLLELADGGTDLLPRGSWKCGWWVARWIRVGQCLVHHLLTDRCYISGRNATIFRITADFSDYECLIPPASKIAFTRHKVPPSTF